MEPEDDRKLKKLLLEWKVEDAPRSLDERVLGARKPWWKVLIHGSVPMPVPAVLCFTVLFVAMAAALVRSASRAAPPAPAVSSTTGLADFRPVHSVQVRIMRGGYADN